ncbi:MAG: hypothetical protein AB1540_06785 [Bdellovibrionota bacterium]
MKSRNLSPRTLRFCSLAIALCWLNQIAWANLQDQGARCEKIFTATERIHEADALADILLRKQARISELSERLKKVEAELRQTEASLRVLDPEIADGVEAPLLGEVFLLPSSRSKVLTFDAFAELVEARSATLSTGEFFVFAREVIDAVDRFWWVTHVSMASKVFQTLAQSSREVVLSNQQVALLKQAVERKIESDFSKSLSYPGRLQFYKNDPHVVPLDRMVWGRKAHLLLEQELLRDLLKQAQRDFSEVKL